MAPSPSDLTIFSRTFGLVQAFRWSPDVMTLTQENKTRNLTSLKQSYIRLGTQDLLHRSGSDQQGVGRVS